MKKIKKLFVLIMPILLIAGLSAGCSDIKNNSSQKSSVNVYFNRGVYKSYSSEETQNKYDFYIFNDGNTGHTEDSEMGIGLPFSCIQEENAVKFRFGGSEEPEETLKIESAQNEVIKGAFDDGKLLIFTPLKEENPDNFDALEYMKKSEK
ncbi:hypothetical protein IKQ26_00515 [bacterium]|nr:hypothetical protein [bacterium]